MDEIIKQGFNTSADNIFGVFVGTLFCFVILGGLVIRYITKKFYDYIEQSRKEDLSRYEKLQKEKEQISVLYIKQLKEEKENQLKVIQASTLAYQKLTDELRGHRDTGSRVFKSVLETDESIKGILKELQIMNAVKHGQ